MQRVSRAFGHLPGLLARVLRPAADPWWIACFVVVLGLALSIGLYFAFGNGLRPLDEALWLGLFLPVPAFFLVAFLAARMRSSLLGIAAATGASGLALAAAWDATFSDSSSTAALAILAAPPLMAICGVGVLVIESVARALVDRSLARPGATPVETGGLLRLIRVGLISLVAGLVAAVVLLAGGCDRFEDTAARAAGVESVRCEELDSSVLCTVVGPDDVALAKECVDGAWLGGCELADPPATADLAERWWTVATRLHAQGIRFRFSIAVEHGSLGRFGSKFVGTNSDSRYLYDWILLVKGGRAADPSSTHTAEEEILGPTPSYGMERDFKQGTLINLLDGSALWTRDDLPADTRDAIAAGAAYSQPASPPA